jgi:REP element-mobilizing transposase RayT
VSLGIGNLQLSRILETLMAEKFRNRYRVSTNRLWGYDYTRDGAYFITICTKKHICYLGDIVVEKGLRPFSTNNRSDYHNLNYKCHPKSRTILNLSDEGKIVSDCWFDLPNHYYNIILDEFIVMPNHIHGILFIRNNISKAQIHGLSEFVRALKSFSSRRINELRKSNVAGTWQSGYYDHVISSDNELNRIRTYIKNNPENWFNDENYIS